MGYCPWDHKESDMTEHALAHPLRLQLCLEALRTLWGWELKVRSEEATGAKTSGIILSSHSHPTPGHNFSPLPTPYHLLLTAQSWSYGPFLFLSGI